MPKDMREDKFDRFMIAEINKSVNSARESFQKAALDLHNSFIDIYGNLELTGGNFAVTQLYQALVATDVAAEGFLRNENVNGEEAKNFLKNLLILKNMVYQYQLEKVGKLVPMQVDFETKNGFVSSENQAREILEIALKQLQENPEQNIGITYSANYNRQTVPLHEQLQQNQRYTKIEGSNQADVVHEIEKLLKSDPKYKTVDEHFFILPITTCEKPGGKGNVKNAWLAADLQAINDFIANGNTVLGWQNQVSVKQPQGPFAVGGGVSQALTNEQQNLIQSHLHNLSKDPLVCKNKVEKLPEKEASISTHRSFFSNLRGKKSPEPVAAIHSSRDFQTTILESPLENLQQFFEKNDLNNLDHQKAYQVFLIIKNYSASLLPNERPRHLELLSCLMKGNYHYENQDTFFNNDIFQNFIDSVKTLKKTLFPTMEDFVHSANENIVAIYETIKSVEGWDNEHRQQIVEAAKEIHKILSQDTDIAPSIGIQSSFQTLEHIARQDGGFEKGNLELITSALHAMESTIGRTLSSLKEESSFRPPQ